MSEHSYTKLRKFDRCVAGMMADPDCTGDLLLMGIWLARATILNDPPRGDGNWKFDKVAETLYGKRHVPRWATAQVRDTIKKDIPRYDMWSDQANGKSTPRCGAPMIRRAGECGKRATYSTYFTDAKTGRRYLAGGCSRHRAWFDAAHKANRAEVSAAGKLIPQPPQNAGGVLERHITGLNWPNLYRQFDENWVLPPQGESFTPPKLRLLTFEPA